ncbi:AMP-binding protein [Nocardia beijingensis]
MTWQELVHMTEACERQLRAADVDSTDLVLTVGPPGPATFSTILACLRTGVGILPITEPQWRVRENQFSDEVTLSWDGADMVRHGRSGEAGSGVESGYIAYFTSGTTGSPKLVRQPPRRGRYRGVAVVERYGAGPAAGPHLMGNPTFHLGTLGPALYSLQAGSCVVVLDKWSASDFLHAAAEHRASSGFVSAGDIFDLVTRPGPATPDLSSLQHGGSHVPMWLKRAAIERFGPGLIEFYGTSRGAISDISGAEWLAHPGSVGRPYRGVTVQVDDAAGIGPLRVAHRRGGSEDAVAEKTGDVGFIEDGFIYIVGRDTEHGRIPHLRKLISEVNGVVEAVLFQGHGRIIGAVEATSESAAREVDNILAAESGEIVIKHFSPYSLPRTPSAKVALPETHVLLSGDTEPGPYSPNGENHGA